MPNSKKVTNLDGKLINILEDVPNSVSSSNLVNGRAPVSIKNNGSTIGQRDILNFILPGGSTVVDTGTQINISFGDELGTFIFRPGAVSPEGNVYNDFSLLYTDLALVDGQTRILFDNSLGAVSIPAGAYDFSNTLLSRFDYPNYPTMGGTVIPVNLVDGVTFTGNKIFVSGIRLRSLSTSPIITLAEDAFLFLQEGAELESTGSSSFVSQPGGIAVSTLFMDKSKLLNSSQLVIEMVGAASNFDIYLFNDSTIETETIGSGDVADTIGIHKKSPGAFFNTTQSSITGTVTITLENYSRNINYDPSIAGILVATDVQSAIDELATSGGGSGLSPAQDVFSPTPAQTGFVLSSSPDASSTFIVTVNGVRYGPSSYTVGPGTAFTWDDVPFAFAGTEELIVDYFV